MNRLISQTETEAPLELVGGKAKGLLRLKSLEAKLNEEYVRYHAQVIVPSFFIVPPELRLADNYRKILERVGELESDRFAIRSSSQLEDIGEHSFDGIFDTQLEVPRDRLVRAIHQVRRSATSDRARKYAKEIGVELVGDMSVIVQIMANGYEKGVVYSKFPCPKDLLKVIRDEHYGSETKREIEAFPRERGEDGKIWINTSKPVVISRSHSDHYNDEIESLSYTAIEIENELGYPVIMEFVSQTPNSSDEKFRISPLQARRLTRLSKDERFQMPELQDKGLIATTYDLNGTGDFRGESYVITNHYGTSGVGTEGLDEFDESHPEGYVLVTPYLQFYHTCLDDWTPNKRAVIAYTNLGHHHDMEVSRKKGILYLNAKSCLNQAFYNAKEHDERAPIETGETIRVISNGEKGLIFNLSR